MPGPQSDQLSATRYSIVVDGIEVAAFNELVGLETEVEPAPPPSSGGLGTPKSPNVTLKRGMTGGLELFAWHQSVRGGDPSARKRATLVMFDATGSPVARFEMQNAWPSKLLISPLETDSSELLFETATLVCESLGRVSPS